MPESSTRPPAFPVKNTSASPTRAHAAPGVAEPSAGDLATARSALKEGLALREKGDLVGALGRLTTAHDLVATPVTLFELGKTHLLMGHVLQAHELFIKIGRLSRYRVADVDEWISQNRYENTSQITRRDGGGQ